MTTRPGRAAASLLLTLVLAACGGGDITVDADTAQDRGAAPLAAAPAPAQVLADLRRHALALQATAVPANEAARQLMDHAEQQFPQYFPAHAATAQLAPFDYRYYAATGVYLGVAIGAGTAYVDQGVYVMGGAFGGAPQYVGRVTDFIAPVETRIAAHFDSDKALVMQGGSRTLALTLTRAPGFDAAAEVTVGGLPAGVSARPLTLAAGATQAQLVLDALPGAAHSLPTSATVTLRAADAVISSGITVTVRGAAGSVDTSFGGGVQVTPVDIGEDRVNAVAVQPDGKVVVAGSSATVHGTVFSLVRYGRDGGLDPSFGQQGKLLLPVGSKGNDVAFALAVQPDGRIVVAGSSDSGATGLDMAVLRLMPDGTLDASFADGGKRVLDLAGDADRARALALQDDGAIVVGGEANTGSTRSGVDFALLRLTATGQLDAGFGNGGIVLTPLKSATGADVLRALALPVIDGRQHILAVGGEGDFLAARYTPQGALDTRFGAGGKVVGLFNSNIGGAYGVALLPGGQAVLAGHVNHHFAAAQLSASGQLDAGFGTAGRFEHSLVTNWNEANAVVRQADGSLLLAGWAYSGAGSSGDFAAIRLTAGGQLDGGFAQGGVLIQATAPGTKNDTSQALVLQADERVPTVRAIQAGEANSSNHDVVVLRLWL